jgi:invasion protein IalB
MVMKSISVAAVVAMLGASVCVAEVLNPQPDAAAPAATESSDSAKADVKKFGLWNVSCVAEMRCVASTALVKKNSSDKIKKVAEVRIIKDGDATNVAVQIPAGVLIRPGVNLTAGDVSVKLDYSLCGSAFCIASALMTEDSLAALKAASEMKVVVVAAPNAKLKSPQKITFNFKLDGSADALAALEAGK